MSFSGASDGYVVGQSIAAGASVNPGTTVTVTIKGESPEPGQNPVMNFIGKYGADRATALVEAVGEKDAKITVEWASSASSGSTWVMQGTFDESKLTVKYTKGTKTDYEYADEKTKTETVVYTDGTGTITFSDSGALSFTWADDKEHVADGVTFKYAS